jgi:hypothetical protein
VTQLGMTCIGGDNAPYIWVNTGRDSWEFFDLLLNKAQVVCTPAPASASAARATCASAPSTPARTSTTALARIAAALKEGLYAPDSSRDKPAPTVTESRLSGRQVIPIALSFYAVVIARCAKRAVAIYLDCFVASLLAMTVYFHRAIGIRRTGPVRREHDIPARGGAGRSALPLTAPVPV